MKNKQKQGKKEKPASAKYALRKLAEIKERINRP